MSLWKPKFTDERPPYSWMKLVGQALVDLDDQVQPEEIVDWIRDSYTYYSNFQSYRLIQSNVRRTLTRYPNYFEKKNHIGEGVLWQITRKFKEQMRETAYQPQRVNEKTGKCYPFKLENSVIVAPSGLTCDKIIDLNVKPETIDLTTQDEPFNQLFETVFCKSENMLETGANVTENVSGVFTGTTIDLTEDSEDGEDTSPNLQLECPICGLKFRTNEQLGGHVIVHSRRNEKIKDTHKSVSSDAVKSLQNIFGNDNNAPICVFTGNVYLTGEN